MRNTLGRADEEKQQFDVYLFSVLAQLSARPCDAVPLATGLLLREEMSKRRLRAKKHSVSKETNVSPRKLLKDCCISRILLKDVISDHTLAHPVQSIKCSGFRFDLFACVLYVFVFVLGCVYFMGY